MEPDQQWVKNTLNVLGICLAGMAGWVIAWQSGAWKPTPIAGPETSGDIATGAQVLGYFSAVCYLGYVSPVVKFPHG